MSLCSGYYSPFKDRYGSVSQTVRVQVYHRKQATLNDLCEEEGGEGGGSSVRLQICYEIQERENAGQKHPNSVLTLTVRFQRAIFCKFCANT